MHIIPTMAHRSSSTMTPAPRRQWVACQAQPIDLTEKSTPVNRTVLGGFGLVARATRVLWHNRAETQALLPELQKYMQEVTNPKLAAVADYPTYLLDNTLHGYPHGNFHANSSLDAESAVCVFNGMIMGTTLRPRACQPRVARRNNGADVGVLRQSPSDNASASVGSLLWHGGIE